MSQFRQPSGRLVPVTGSDGVPFVAFVPDPLPPAAEAAAVARCGALLEAANHALGRLDGVGLLLPNPDHLVRPYMRREAVLSSRIEGTQTSFAELVAAEADPRAITPDAREVLNYVQALDHGLRRVAEEGIGADLVRGLHRHLMSGVRGEAFAAPGEFRTIQNHIGASNDPRAARFVPPPPAEALAALDELFAYMAQPPEHSSVLVQGAWLHYQFEAIHPFLDGNGRVGRLLIPLLVAHRRRLTHPLLYLSPYFEQRRQEYYELLLAVSSGSEWEAWLRFFLEGVRSQAESAIALARGIIGLGQEWHARLNAVRAPHTAHRAADIFHQFVALTPRALESLLGVSTQTAYNAVQALEAAGIVAPTASGQRRGQVYSARELVSLFVQV